MHPGDYVEAGCTLVTYAGGDNRACYEGRDDYHRNPGNPPLRGCSMKDHPCGKLLTGGRTALCDGRAGSSGPAIWRSGAGGPRLEARVCYRLLTTTGRDGGGLDALESAGVRGLSWAVLHLGGHQTWELGPAGAAVGNTLCPCPVTQHQNYPWKNGPPELHYCLDLVGSKYICHVHKAPYAP